MQFAPAMLVISSVAAIVSLVLPLAAFFTPFYCPKRPFLQLFFSLIQLPLLHSKQLHALRWLREKCHFRGIHYVHAIIFLMRLSLADEYPLLTASISVAVMSSICLDDKNTRSLSGATRGSTTHVESSSSAHVEPSSSTHVEPASSTHVEPASSTHVEPASSTHMESSSTHVESSSSGIQTRESNAEPTREVMNGSTDEPTGGKSCVESTDSAVQIYKQILLNRIAPMCIVVLGTCSILALRHMYSEALCFLMVLVMTGSSCSTLLGSLVFWESHCDHLMRELKHATVAKSNFLSNISHELRSPLLSVTGSVDLLQMTKLDSQQEKYVSTIETCSNLLLMLIEDVLHFSQLGLAEREMKVERKPFALEPCFKIIEEVVRPYASQFEVEVKKEVDILSFPPMVLGDPTHFKRVVLALLTNAIKVSPKDKPVRLCIENTTQSSNTLALVRVTVIDHGPGIPQQKRNEIFKPFSYVNHNTSPVRKYPSAGLGLATSKRLIELMGGSICFRTGPQSGTTFVIEIPFPIIHDNIQSDDLQLEELNDLIELDAHSNYVQHYNLFERRKDTSVAIGPLAILAEDNAINRTVLNKLLKKVGFKVTTVNDGQELVGACKREIFSLVITDYHMPRLDGVEAARQLREIYDSRVKIVLLTADTLANVQPFGELFDAILIKPIRFQELKNAIDSLQIRKKL